MENKTLALISLILVLKRKIRKKEVAKAWDEANREHKNVLNRVWKNANKERRAVYAKQWNKDNAEHVREYARAHRAAKAEHYTEYNRERWRRNPDIILAYNQNRRARKKGNGGTHKAEQWQSLKKFYGNKCLCCGRLEEDLAKAGLKLSRDHVNPIKLGGTNDISNIQPLCSGRGGCNNRKQAKHIDYRVPEVLCQSASAQ